MSVDDCVLLELSRLARAHGVSLVLKLAAACFWNSAVKWCWSFKHRGGGPLSCRHNPERSILSVLAQNDKAAACDSKNCHLRGPPGGIFYLSGWENKILMQQTGQVVNTPVIHTHTTIREVLRRYERRKPQALLMCA
jgi:hypothetical protein